ncbi:hypothetical protein L1857_22290 [Amycolatopsis thermalba]|uniref:Uncharacterized protein n=1 Tax=Amycolatopsis thermalba TaxID=944492 RepID=A0ABY4NZ70_9PSEU|nr:MULTISPECIES: hypothetical protein [Amycolatopsis]UQS25341.1 hypothetical protein L1857_22290 [Amycolatopsis thermalba]
MLIVIGSARARPGRRGETGDLDAHLTLPHTQAFLARIGDLIDGEPAVAVHEVPSS